MKKISFWFSYTMSDVIIVKNLRMTVLLNYHMVQLLFPRIMIPHGWHIAIIQDSLVESTPNAEYIKVLQQVISDWDFSQKASLIDYCNAKINLMDTVFEDEELKELLDDCYAFSYYYYYCFRFLNFERGFDS